MKLSLDHTFDSANTEVYVLLHGMELPDFVKQAMIPTREEVLQLSSEGFADENRRTYPIFDAGNIFMSQAFFNHKKAELENKYGSEYVERTQARLKQAADMFGITEEVEALSNTMQKQASLKEYIPFISTIDHEGTLVNFFECANKDDFEKSAALFVKDIENLPFSWRKTISEDFVKKASWYGVSELPDLICKYAGLYYPNFATLAGELARRSTKYAQEYKEHVVKLLDVLPEVQSRDEVMKIAELVFEMEDKQGLYEIKRTKELLPDVVDSLFELSPEKVAQELDVVEMGGRRYPVAKLAAVPSEIYKQAFGIDIDPKDKTQIREILPTMPRSDVALFDELVNS